MDNQSESPAAAGGNVAEFTVSEISFAIKKSVEENFAWVRVRGELGRIARPASGHVYLDLKDDKAVLSGVIWRGQAGKLKVQPEQGMEVVATGRLTTYPGQSRYQIVIESLEPAGVGALLAQLEKLKKKLAAEGLFDEARKQPRPFLPRVVGIVTSPTGAVIRDMLHGFDERFPVHALVWPVRVQGQTCGEEVAAAIRGFNALEAGGPVPRPDVLIVARGGGSIEDLWGFNEEIVARAAADSAIPLISAVGHETDWTLIDHAADARAPTPTKAAEWAVPRRADLIDRVQECGRQVRQCWRRVLDAAKAELKTAARGLPRLADLLALPRQRLDTAASRLPFALTSSTARHRANVGSLAGRLRPNILRQSARRRREELTRLDERADRALMQSAARGQVALRSCSERLRPAILRQPAKRHRRDLTRQEERAERALRQFVERRRAAVDAQGKLLESLGHRGVLKRGYALVRDAGGAMVRRADALEAGDAFEVEFADGRVPAVAGKRAAAPKPARGGGGSQGSLF